MRVDKAHTGSESVCMMDWHARAPFKIESGRQLKVLVVQISNFQLNPPLNN
jgi:hypothetical protein